MIQITKSGTEEYWIQLRNYKDERVRVTGEQSAKNGISVIQTCNRTVPRFIAVAGLEVSDLTGNCISASRNGDLVFAGMDIFHCGKGALELHETINILVANSLIHDNKMSGWTSAVDLYLCKSGYTVRGYSIWDNTDEDTTGAQGKGTELCG